MQEDGEYRDKGKEVLHEAWTTCAKGVQFRAVRSVVV